MLGCFRMLRSQAKGYTGRYKVSRTSQHAFYDYHLGKGSKMNGLPGLEI